MQFAMGGSACFVTLALLFNGIMLIGMFQETGDSPSNSSWMALALSILSLFVIPCGAIGGMIAIGLARYERVKIYNQESSLKSATPCDLATANGALSIVLSAIIFVAAVLEVL